jgi:hypothetical protein
MTLPPPAGYGHLGIRMPAVDINIIIRDSLFPLFSCSNWDIVYSGYHGHHEKSNDIGLQKDKRENRLRKVVQQGWWRLQVR